MTKIEGYEDCHVVNENNPASLSPDSPAQPISAGLDSDAQIASMSLHAAPVDAQDGGGESNGGEIRQGDASTRKDEERSDLGGTASGSAPSPTSTREELVEACKTLDFDKAARMYKTGLGGINDVIRAALDALIAIGAVRVK